MPTAVEPAAETGTSAETHVPTETHVSAKAVVIRTRMITSERMDPVVARIPGPIESKRRVIRVGIAGIPVNRIGIVRVGGIRVGRDQRWLSHAGRISAGSCIRRYGGQLLGLLIRRIGLPLDLRAVTNQRRDDLRSHSRIVQPANFFRA